MASIKRPRRAWEAPRVVDFGDGKPRTAVNPLVVGVVAAARRKYQTSWFTWGSREAAAGFSSWPGPCFRCSALNRAERDEEADRGSPCRTAVAERA